MHPVPADESPPRLQHPGPLPVEGSFVRHVAAAFGQIDDIKLVGRKRHPHAIAQDEVHLAGQPLPLGQFSCQRKLHRNDVQSTAVRPLPPAHPPPSPPTTPPNPQTPPPPPPAP